MATGATETSKQTTSKILDRSGAQTERQNHNMTLSHDTWALLIGINCYIPGRAGNKRSVHYGNLKGCVNDTLAVKNYLESIGVRNIKRLTSTTDPKSGRPIEERSEKIPTFANVERELESITKKASRGDLVYIHYSGHGIRREALGTQEGQRFSGDKINGTALALADVMDEGPYLTGYQLGVFVKRMVKLKDLRVTLILDSCFSGQGTRDAIYSTSSYIGYRTADEGFDSMTLPVDLEVDDRIAEIDRTIGDSSESRNAIVKASWLANPTGCTILTACDFNESAREETKSGSTSTHGAFTFYMLERLQQNLASSSSRRPTHAHVRDYVEEKLSQSHKQSPVLHGDGEHIFFGKERVIERPLCRILTQTDDEVELDIGYAQGVSLGAKYTVYPENQVPGSNNSTPFEAYVTNLSASNPFRSTAAIIRPDDYIGPINLKSGSAMLDTWALPETTVDISPSLRRALSSAGIPLQTLEDELTAVGITISDPGDKTDPKPSYILDLNNTQVLQIYTQTKSNNRERIQRIPKILLTDPNWAKDITTVLNHICRFQSLRNIRNTDPCCQLPPNCLEILVKQRPNRRAKVRLLETINGRYNTLHGAQIAYSFRLSDKYTASGSSHLFASFYMFNATWGITKLHPALGQPSIQLSNTKRESFILEMDVPPPRCAEDPDCIEDVIRVFLCTANKSWEDVSLEELPAEMPVTPLKHEETIIDGTMAEGMDDDTMGGRNGIAKPGGFDGDDDFDFDEKWGFVDIVVRTSPMIEGVAGALV
ncbi:Metacaspase-1 [Arthrobotrys entomopaga]|nr:Metacaspase-1 [Arthrobotrys entomopaga]